MSYYVSKGEDVTGYVAATVYEKMAWVGPLVCREGKIDVAVTLLKGVLSKLTGLSVYVALPKKEIALQKLFMPQALRRIFLLQGCFLDQTLQEIVYTWLNL